MGKNVWKKVVLSLVVTVFVTATLAVTAQAGGASFAQAQEVSVGQRQQLSFETSGDAQYYCFTTDSVSGWYSINFGKSGGERKYLEVYATPDKSSPVLSDWSLFSDGNDTTVLSLSPNKKYYIMVVPYAGRAGGTANFTITKINDDYGNDLATGKMISLGTTITGNIEVDGMREVDAFRFTTTGNDSYYEISTSCLGNTRACARIYSGPDTSYDYYEVLAKAASTNSIVIKLEKNKTYYVLLGDFFFNASAEYKFVVKEIKDDAGDDFKDATKLSNGKTASKTIQVDQDTDFFKFKTKKKEAYYLLTFKNKSKSDMRVTVYNNDDIASTVSTFNNVRVEAASTKTIWIKLKKNKNNFVKVTGTGKSSYTIQLKDLKSVVKKTAPTSFKATANDGYLGKYVVLSWKYKYENSKYEIYRSTSQKSGFKRIKTVQGLSSYRDSKVKKGTTYYYKIRYCVKENGKVCTAKWSKVKKVKVK